MRASRAVRGGTAVVFAAVLLATAAACGASDEPDDRVITLPQLP